MNREGRERMNRGRWWTIAAYGLVVVVLAGGLAYLGRSVIKRPWSARDRIAAAGVGDTVFVFGGENNAVGLLDEILGIDVRRKTVAVVGHLPVPCCSAAAVSLEGQVYVLGGQRVGGYCSSVLRFDPRATGDPERIGDLPTPRAHGAAVACGEKLYYLGGWDGAQRLDEVVEIDPATGESQIVGRLPSPRQSLAAVAVDGRILAIGGENADRDPMAEVIAVEPESGRVARLADLPVARERCAAVTVSGMPVLLGGWSGHGLDDIVRLDPASGVVLDEAPGRLPHPMPDCVATVARAEVYVLDKNDPDFDRQIGIWAIDPTTWKTTALRLRAPW